jgi:hypothetical protein
MAEAINPYAPPRAAVIDAPGDACWRVGKVIVVRIGRELPHRCVSCNEPAREPVPTRSMSWHHPAWFILFFISIPIYIITALIVRKRAKLGVPLCEKHRHRRVVFLSVAWIGSLVGLLTMLVTAVNEMSGVLTAAGLVLLLVAVGFGVAARSVYPARITKEEVHLKGCGAAFLDSIPEGR